MCLSGVVLHFLTLALTSAADEASLKWWDLISVVPKLLQVLPWSLWRQGLALGLCLCQSGGPKKGTDHEIHGEEAVTASSQAGVRQQAVDAIGDASIKLQLPLHYLTLSVVQEKRTLRDGMGRGECDKS